MSLHYLNYIVLLNGILYLGVVVNWDDSQWELK